MPGWREKAERNLEIAQEKLAGESPMSTWFASSQKDGGELAIQISPALMPEQMASLDDLAELSVGDVEDVIALIEGSNEGLLNSAWMTS